MKKIFILFSVVSFTASVTVFAQPWDANFYFNRADQYKIQNDLEKALEMYNAILSQEPENVRALNGRGVIYQKRGEFLKAKADFQYAVTISPSNAESRHNLESVNERIKTSTGFTDSVMNTEYKDAIRFLGTTEYTVIGSVNDPSTPVLPGPIPLTQTTAYIAESYTTPATVYAESAAAPVQTAAPAASQTTAHPAIVAEENYQKQLSTGNMSSLYERTAQTTPSGSLYDRTASNAPGIQGGEYNYGSLQNGGTPQYPGTYHYSYPGTVSVSTPPAYTARPPAQHLYPPPDQTGSSARLPQQVTTLPQQVVTTTPYPSTATVTTTRTQQLPLFSTNVQSLRFDSATGYLGYGLDAASVAYYERVILAYTDVIVRNPAFAIAYNNRGVAYARMRDWVRALEDFNQALRLNPYYFDAQSNREQVKYSMSISR